MPISRSHLGSLSSLPWASSSPAACRALNTAAEAAVLKPGMRSEKKRSESCCSVIMISRAGTPCSETNSINKTHPLHGTCACAPYGSKHKTKGPVKIVWQAQGNAGWHLLLQGFHVLLDPGRRRLVTLHVHKQRRWELPPLSALRCVLQGQVLGVYSHDNGADTLYKHISTFNGKLAAAPVPPLLTHSPSHGLDFFTVVSTGLQSTSTKGRSRELGRLL